jgi:hypothetical protein
MKCRLCDREFSEQEISSAIPIASLNVGARVFAVRFADGLVHHFAKPTAKAEAKAKSKAKSQGAFVLPPPPPAAALLEIEIFKNDLEGSK